MNVGKILKDAGKFLVGSGAGLGLLTTAAGIAMHDSQIMIGGAQLATAGAIKIASRAAGRELHNWVSPAASILVGAVGQHFGIPALVGLPAAVSGGPTAVAELVQTTLQGALIGGMQSYGKNVFRSVLGGMAGRIQAPAR